MTEWQIKPPQQNVAPLAYLKILAETYPNESIRPSISQLSKPFPYYRPIYGDGNCFYRAFAFLYLRETPLHKFEDLFENVDMVCRNLPIQFGGVTFRETLREAYERFLKPIAGINDTIQKENELQRIFNKSWIFDTLMIAYFRSLNHRQIKHYQNDYREYLSESLEHELQKVATFNKQSEGVQLESLPSVFNIKLVVFLVQTDIVKEIVYSRKGKNLDFMMFFRPGHYDLVYADSERLRSFLTQRESRQENNFMQSVGKSMGSFWRKEYTTEQSYQRNSQPARDRSPPRFSDENLNTKVHSQKAFTDPRVSVSRKMQEEANITEKKIGANFNQRNKKENTDSAYSNRNSGYSQGVQKTENTRQFTSSSATRDNSNEAFSQRGAVYSTPNHHYSVKNKIEESDWNLGRFLVELFGIVVFFTASFYFLTGYFK